MSSIRKLASQTAIYGLSSIVGRLLNYLLVPLYTNLFLPDEYGVVTELYAYASFLNVLLTYGMETAFFRFSQSHDFNKDEVYSSSLLSVIFTTLILLFAGIWNLSWIAEKLHYESLKWYIAVFMLIGAIDAITAIPFARLRDQNRPMRFATVRLANIFLNIFFNLFFLLLCPWLIKNGYSLPNWIYNDGIGVGYIFISNLLASLLAMLLLLPELRIKFNFNLQVWKQLIKYALPLLLVGLAGMVNETSDRVMLKYLLPDGTDVMYATGIYGACYKISIIMTIFIQTFRYAAEPFFFNHNKTTNGRQVYSDVMHYFIIACSVIFLATILYIDLVKYFVGKKYWSGLPVVPVLLMANFCLGIYYNLTIWYKLTNQTRKGAYIALIGAAITLLSNLILIPLTGYMGAAWSTLICYFSMMLLSYFQGKKSFPVPYQTGKDLFIIGMALALYFISGLWQDTSMPVKILLNSLVFMLYSAWLIFTEKDKLKNYLPEKLKKHLR